MTYFALFHPIQNDLLNRDIISAEASLCIAGCGQDESASHLFLHCDIFGSLWQHVRSWIGVSGADPQSLHAHFFQVYSLLTWFEGSSIFSLAVVASLRLVSLE